MPQQGNSLVVPAIQLSYLVSGSAQLGEGVGEQVAQVSKRSPLVQL